MLIRSHFMVDNYIAEQLNMEIHLSTHVTGDGHRSTEVKKKTALRCGRGKAHKGRCFHQILGVLSPPGMQCEIS